MYFEGVQVDKGRAVGGDDEVDVLEVAVGDAVPVEHIENMKYLIEHM